MTVLDVVAAENKTIVKPLEGKVAIVTGGSRGIGAAIARELADKGAHVAINYQSRSDAADEVIKDIEENEGSAIAVKADVSNSQDIADLIEEVKNKYGKIDILVNNAGITRDRTFRRLSEE